MLGKIGRSTLIPFRFEKSSHITVLAKLSGEEVRLIVDTGAGGTCIDSNEVERFNLRLSKRSQKGGGVGSSSMQIIGIAKHDLAVAGLDLSTYKLHALDLSHVNAGLVAAGVKAVAGVLGADILFDRQAIVDYGRGHIILAEASRK